MLDSPEELLRKIRLGEDTVLELKTVPFKGGQVEKSWRNKLADELAAMGNTADGVLVLGVDDVQREVVGIPVDRLDAVEQVVFEVCTDSIRPPLSFHTLRLELPDTEGTLQPVLKVEVPRSLFVHQSPGGYFQRQGSSRRPLPPDQLARLFQQRSQARLIRFDEQAVPETSSADLDQALWQRFLGPRVEEPLETLRKIRLLTEDDAGRERASVAGVLMCSRHPESWLKGAFIEAVRYRGKRQDSNYQLDAEQITGPLDRQVVDSLRFVRRNMSVAAVKRPGREELPQYSERAVFEALVNAVAHRDYSIHGSKVRLFLFEDRLELYSPGALPNTVTLESLPLRQSTRNELLVSLLARCPVEDVSHSSGRQFFMEARGDGVPIILEESRRLSGCEPKYQLIDEAELLLTLYAATPTPSD